MIDLLYFKWTEPVINDLPNHLLKKKQYFNNRLAHKIYEKRFKQQEYTGDHSQIFLSNLLIKSSFKVITKHVCFHHKPTTDLIVLHIVLVLALLYYSRANKSLNAF